LLLGLLAESECRAALMLARKGIDTAAVGRQWPQFAALETPGANDLPADHARGDSNAPPADTRPQDLPQTPTWPLSAEVEASLATASERLAEYPRPLVLATEHLLLGLAAAEHGVSLWLRQRGIDPDAVEAEIHRLYDPRPAALPSDAAWQTEPIPADAPPLAPDRQPDGPVLEEEPPVAAQIPLSQQTGVLRVIDAAINRAREGLRVVEDHVRFLLDDPHLTDELKRLRHDLAAVLRPVSLDRQMAARETRSDVGTSLVTPSEQLRKDTTGVLGANFMRLEEALRSLEEFGKLLDAGMAAELKQLRYRTYTLHRAVQITQTSCRRLSRTRLYVLLDGRPSPEEFDTMVGLLVRSGVHAIQLRDKGLDDRRLLRRARRLRRLTAESDVLVIINDRPDLAALAGADGVHLGQEELSVKDARTIVGPDALVGVSTHSIDQAREAVLDGANYIGVGPTFPSATKHFDQFPGLGLVRAVAAQIRLPAFAIGGITPENLPEVLAAGLHRVAVSGAITNADDPTKAVRKLLSVLGS